MSSTPHAVEIAGRINEQAALDVQQESRLAPCENVSPYSITPDRVLEAEELFRKDKSVSDFWREKYRKDAVKNWDLFYRRNEANFFKDRMWLDKEFEEIKGGDNPPSYRTEVDIKGEEYDFSRDIKIEGDIYQKDVNKINEKDRYLLIEVGCGVGNALLPILLRNNKIDAIGLDCSKRAIAYLKSRWCALRGVKEEMKDGTCDMCMNDQQTSINNDVNNTDIAHDGSKVVVSNSESVENWKGGELIGSGVWDVTQCQAPEICSEKSADFVLLLFVLSAINPSEFENVAKRVAQLLKPGGLLLFRDYGRYDDKQLRFAKSKRSQVSDNFYVRQDGTLAYFFLTEEIHHIFSDVCGFSQVENRYILRQIRNRKTNLEMNRVWIQAKYRKPIFT